MRIALCKINMIGAPVLILGHEYVREDYEKPYWDKYQLFTFEDLVGNNTFNQEMIKPRADKYGGKTVHFTSINKELTPFVSAHDFSFTDAEAVEVTRDEWHALVKELNKDQWEAFDWETWGK